MPATKYADLILSPVTVSVTRDDPGISAECTDEVRRNVEAARTGWYLVYSGNPKRHFNKLAPLHQGDRGLADYFLRATMTGQEWCHLYGHGDGGRETPNNLVSGSHYANTEQLAIETGQRLGRYGGLTVNVTAYRVAQFGPEPELAAWIRYQIYVTRTVAGGAPTSVKIFDHVFDGQSETFDYNQFKILRATVERVVADGLKSAAARAKYLKRVNQKISARAKTDKLTNPPYVYDFAWTGGDPV